MVRIVLLIAQTLWYHQNCQVFEGNQCGSPSLRGFKWKGQQESLSQMEGSTSRFDAWATASPGEKVSFTHIYSPGIFSDVASLCWFFMSFSSLWMEWVRAEDSRRWEIPISLWCISVVSHLERQFLLESCLDDALLNFIGFGKKWAS